MKSVASFLLMIFSACVVPVSADERADVYRELSELKKNYRKQIGDIRKSGNPRLKAEQMKSLKAIAAVGKGIEDHPDLAEQRKARDEAKKVYDAARKEKDPEKMKITGRKFRDAEGALSRDGFKLKEIKELQAASVAQRKKVEALQYQLVAESSDEGKVLIKKLKDLEARYEKLKK